MPNFHFKVEWGKAVLSFQEVSGLEVKSNEIKYRSGDSKVFSVTKMPGLLEYGNVTMKKGVFKGDNKFWEWLVKIQGNTIERIPITISLLDEKHEAVMIWKLVNAWPLKISSTDMKSEGNEVAIESIEIVHEGLTIENKA
jgi:phage tail-like protein